MSGNSNGYMSRRSRFRYSTGCPHKSVGASCSGNTIKERPAHEGQIYVEGKMEFGEIGESIVENPGDFTWVDMSILYNKSDKPYHSLETLLWVVQR